MNRIVKEGILPHSVAPEDAVLVAFWWRLPLDHDGLVGPTTSDDVLRSGTGGLLWEGDTAEHTWTHIHACWDLKRETGFKKNTPLPKKYVPILNSIWESQRTPVLLHHINTIFLPSQNSPTAWGEDESEIGGGNLVPNGVTERVESAPPLLHNTQTEPPWISSGKGAGSMRECDRLVQGRGAETSAWSCGEAKPDLASDLNPSRGV